MEESNLMPFGKYQGQAMASVPTVYLMWSLTMLNIRRGYHPYVFAVLQELRDRLDRDIGAVHAELVMPPLPKKPPRRVRRLIALAKQFETRFNR